MGNYILIKNANFSQVAVEQVVVNDYDYLDFSSLTRVDLFNNSGTFVSAKSCYFIQPVTRDSKFGVMANDLKVAQVAFLKSMPTSAGQVADLCDMSQAQYWDDDAKVLKVPAGVTAVWTIPEDCNYVYIASLTQSYGDYTPSYAWFEP